MLKLIGIGMALVIFGGMGLDGTESNIAFLIACAGLVLMIIGLIKSKAIMFALMFSVFMFVPKVDANANPMDKQVLSDVAIQACIDVGQEYGICPELLMSIIETESTGKADAENNGCIGLMQINQRWHKDRMKKLAVTDLYDEYSNILIGADYLMELAEKHGDVGLVLMVYHGESKAFENYEKGILSSYATKILERSEFLEREHGK